MIFLLVPWLLVGCGASQPTPLPGSAPTTRTEPKPAKPGVFTLSLQNIRGEYEHSEYQTVWAHYTYDIVFEAKSHIGGTITAFQFCNFQHDGRATMKYHGCDPKEYREYRIEPYGKFTKHVTRWAIRGTPWSIVGYDRNYYKYWGIDDGGNPIYLEISLSYSDVFRR